MPQRAKLLLTLFLPVQILLIRIIAFFPEWIERWYSNGFFVILSKLFRYVFGWIPFSFGDLVYIALIIFFIRFLILKVFTKFIRWQSLLLEIGATLSIFYGLFHILWGMNYYRQPLHTILQIDDAYTEEELYQVSKLFIEKANVLHQQLESNDSLAVVMPYTKNEIFEKTVDAYKELSEDYPFPDYKPISLKKSMLSLPLTYMGFSGYLNPLTGEGQVNSKILNYKAPTTSCHEEAHQLGFAKENEANFISILTTMNYSDIYFRYSGTTFALKFCINDLYYRDQQKAICLLEENLRPGVRENFRKVNEFWERYQNPLEPIFKDSYDSYLKANNQPDGMKTYSYVSALIVNYFKSEGFN